MLATNWAASFTSSSPSGRYHLMMMMILVRLLVIEVLLSSAQEQARFGGAATSELKFEEQKLKSIPIAQLCNATAIKQDQQINVVSFASNQIGQLESNAFECISSALKILNLRQNRISQISRQAFEGLNLVQVLLLDNNQLERIPSIETLSELRSLRHLNLAGNKIATLPSEAFGLANANLISLNLNANPLHDISANSLVNLIKLKTLILSQSELSGQFNTLAGLNELRFLHLDRAKNLSSTAANLCANSRKLTSLVLKSNRFEQIPQFEHCQNLLQLDLSYNLLTGILSENFTGQPNLIDLYLGHNQIESIGERAFVGLDKLQVLELNNNRLLQIHLNAFLPIRGSIYELNLANNHQLSRLHSNGLERLSSLRAFGNEQLRELPKFGAAKLLALTYAYHCCDYLEETQPEEERPVLADDGRLKSSNERRSLIGQLVDSILVSLFGGAKLAGHQHEHERQQPTGKVLPISREEDTANLSELIIWPEEDSQKREKGFDLKTRDSLLASSQVEQLSSKKSAGQRARRGLEFHQADYEAAPVIDELLLVGQMEQIRAAHLVLADLGQQVANERPPPSSSSARHLYNWPAWRQSATQTGLDEHFLEHEQGQAAADDVDLLIGLMRVKLERSSHSSLDDIRHAQRAKREQAKQGNSVQCVPEPNAFLPCRDLFDTWWLRAGIWCVFLLAFAGNILVIIVLSSVRQSSSSSALTSIMWLAHSKRHIDVPRFLVINLAIADLLMAIYLGLLAFVDLRTLGEFKLFAIKWQYSNGCKLASFLGVLSSELSVFILAIITLERNYAITNAVHLNRRLSLQKAMIIMLVGYAFAFSMAIMPLNGISDHRKFSICLPLDMDSNLNSQIYVITLISINTFSFLLLLSCYLRMYCAIRGSQAWNTNDLRIAKRMSILVITDFFCWMPIIVVSISSLFGAHLIGPNGIKILTIFILPLNSVANPFLYAITTKKFKRDLDTLMRRLGALVRLDCAQSGQEDPKLFLNYNQHNQYQHNLMAMKKKNKSNLNNHNHNNNANQISARNRRPTMSQQQQQQQMTLKGDSILMRQSEARRRFAMRTQTGNQVTVNRTTCNSCQRILCAQSKFGLESITSNQQVGRLSPGARNQLQPRIVLDSADSSDHQREQHNLEPESGPNNCLDTRSETVQLYHHLHEPAGDEIEIRPMANHHLIVRSAIGYELSNLSAAKSNLSVCCGLSSARSGQCSVRVANLPAEMRDRLSVGLAIASRPSSHISLNTVPDLGQLNQRYLNVGYDGMLLERCCGPGMRSASACGFRPASETAKPPNEPRVSGSCEAMRLSEGSQPSCHIEIEKSSLSRSISRLLFSPIAKAWSSIQISLSSNLALHQSGGVMPTTGQQGDHNSNWRERDDDRIVLSPPSSNSSTCEALHAGQNQSAKFDDILLMSGPAKRSLCRISERRMSRSCDMISQHNNSLASQTNSSCAGQEANTSQADYDDDRRILLATINRMAAASRRTRPGRGQGGSGERPIMVPAAGTSGGRYLRSKCTRCRSWSPALLSKLEDCIHQIKNKIPGLGPARGYEHRAHETMEQSEPSSSAASSNFNESALEMADGARQPEGATIESKNSANRISRWCRETEQSRCQSSEDVNDLDRGEGGADADMVDGEEDEDSEDQFNELDWPRRRADKLGGHRRFKRKLQQQSSTNSDTISTRTGGTVLTNMSVSFDSNTSIPHLGKQTDETNDEA